MPGVLALDLDGTLVTCRERQVGLALHLVPALDGIAFWAAKRDGATTRAALAAQEVADADLIAARWAAGIEEPAWLAADRVAPDAEPALRGIRAAGLRPVVLTARRDAAAARAQLAATPLAALVDDVLVVSPADAAAQKAAHLRALRATGFVGDTESDARAARLAGVAFAATGAGQRAPAFLERCGVAPVHPGVLAAVRSLLPAYAGTAMTYCSAAMSG